MIQWIIDTRAARVRKAGDKHVVRLRDYLYGGDAEPLRVQGLVGLIELGGGDDRIGLCLDSCHMLASGFDVRAADGLSEVIDRCVEIVGTDRLACLHVNDSQTALGSNRDRHAPLGTGELGRKGCAAFFSEPRFEGLPAIFEGPGFDGRGAGPRDIEVARELRAEGLKARGRSRAGRGGRTRGRTRAGARRRTRG